MMKFSPFVVAAVLATSAIACDAPAPTGDTKDSSAADKTADKKTGGDTKPAKDDAPKDVVLEETKDDELGYTIMLPKDSKVLQKDKLSGHTFSFLLGGGHELNTHITGVEHADLAGLKNMATMMGQKDLEEEKEIDGGLLRVIKKAQGPIVEVWVAVKGKPLTAKCTGPTDAKDKLVEICSSLKSNE
jgi:hypothetical protein